MKTPLRLGLYGAGLVACFAAAFGIAAAVVPSSAAQEWSAGASHDEHGADDDGGGQGGAHGGHGGADAAAPLANGVSLDRDGYRLAALTGPEAPGQAGEISFQVIDPDGEPLTEYTESHEKDLHLIAVRTDGADFHHVHPELGADGVWSVPMTWAGGGSYRVFADFVPGGAEETITLTSTVEVAGGYTPQPAAGERREATVGEFQVSLDGDLAVGDTSRLTLTVTRNGEPVTEMQPYLGAYGHLVALRGGDLSYLHVHPEGAEPKAGELSGPEVEFATEAPTDGRYLLYFDFQVAGQVYSAPFELTAGDVPTTERDPAEQPPADDGGAEGHDDGGEEHQH